MVTAMAATGTAAMATEATARAEIASASTIRKNSRRRARNHPRTRQTATTTGPVENIHVFDRFDHRLPDSLLARRGATHATDHAARAHYGARSAPRGPGQPARERCLGHSAGGYHGRIRRPDSDGRLAIGQ